MVTVAVCSVGMGQVCAIAIAIATAISNCYSEPMQRTTLAIASTNVADVPKRPPLRMHCFRCPEDIWERGKAAAEINDETLRRGCVYGSVMASFNVEKFGTERVDELDFPEINQRFKDFKRMTHFDDIPFERAVTA